MVPYRQGKAASADAYKLSSNENPFDPLPGVLEAIAGATAINRYPDATALALRTALAERYGVTPDGIQVGSGSVAVLTQLVTAAAGPGDEVVFSWRSFEAYPGIVAVAGATPVAVPNRADHGHDLPAMAAAVTERTRALIVCTPNNPTGAIVTVAEFHAFMASVPRDILVILDEAYIEFVGDPDAVRGPELLAQYPNLVVLRTFSKAYGLAGLRVGYAIGPVAILDAARSSAIPLSVTAQAETGALASLEHEEQLLERVVAIAERRHEIWNQLIAQGWSAPEPHGNFLWLPTGEATDAAAAAFHEAGLVVRPFHPDGIRISVGEPESVEKLLRVSAEIVGKLPNGHPGRRVA